MHTRSAVRYRLAVFAVPLVTTLALLIPSRTAIAADPHLHWSTFTTAHFQIHFHDGGQAFAARAGAIAEEAYARLHRALGWSPQDAHIQMVCQDLADGANGFANALPYDAITLLAFTPEADTDLGRYDDWLRVLVYHELTHVLHLNQASGWLPVAVNAVLGKTLLPNNALPRWFIEGLATWVESRFTRQGRVGSAQFEMYLRSAALGGTLPTHLGSLTGTPDARPGGTWPYVFGGTFLTWVADHYGAGSLIDFVDRYGAQTIPYGVNNIARQAFKGNDWPTLYAAWRADYVASARRRAQQERQLGLIEGRRLTHSGQTHHAPTFGRDDNTLYLAQSDGFDATWRVRATLSPDARSLRSERLYQCHGGCGRLVVPRFGDLLYVIAGGWSDPYRFFRDLMAWDQKARPRYPTPISHGLRAREPALSPDERHVAAVSAHWGTTELVEIDIYTGTSTILVPASASFDLNQPRYLPDGRLVFSGQRSGQWRDLWLRERDGRLQRVTHTPDREIQPVVHPDGHTIIFSSDQGGIWNLHALDLDTGQRWQVTRVLGGAFNPSISPSGRRLVYSGYGAQGHDVYVLALSQHRAGAPGGPLTPWTPIPASAAAEPPAYRPTPVPGTVRPYRAYRSGWPHSWSPVFQTDSSGIGAVGLRVAGRDSVGLHGWGLDLSFSVQDPDPSIALSYAYYGWRPTISTFLTRWSGESYHYVADTLQPFIRENIYGSTSINVDLPHIEDHLSVRAGLNYWFFFSRDRQVIHHDPGSDTPIVQKDGQFVGIELGWSYDDVEQYPYSISPEKGLRLGATFTLWPGVVGNRSDTWTLTWRADAYVPMPWWRRHVLAFKLRGGLAGGDNADRDSFSIGGFPEQDLAMDLVNQSGLFGTYLRGYDPGEAAGDSYHLLSTEYRFPIWDIQTGPGTLPLWLDRLSGALFSDVGMATYQTPRLDDLKVGIGAELSLTAQVFYALPLTLRLGYAAATTGPFQDRFYVVLGSNL